MPNMGGVSLYSIGNSSGVQKAGPEVHFCVIGNITSVTDSLGRYVH